MSDNKRYSSPPSQSRQARAREPLFMLRSHLLALRLPVHGALAPAPLLRYFEIAALSHGVERHTDAGFALLLELRVPDLRRGRHVLDALGEHVVNRERLSGRHRCHILADPLHPDVMLFAGAAVVAVGRNRRAVLYRYADKHVPHQFLGRGIFEQIEHLFEFRDLLVFGIHLPEIRLALLLARRDAFKDVFKNVHLPLLGRLLFSKTRLAMQVVWRAAREEPPSWLPSAESPYSHAAAARVRTCPAR